MAAIRDIYAHYVLHSLATFEETPPTLDDMLSRRRASVDLGLPYLVAEARGEILGFAYAALYRSRPAYRYAVEDPVYVADGLTGRGIGSALLGELIARCEGGPWRQMLAVVGDSANSGFDRAPSAFRFELVGTLRSVGLMPDAGSTRRSCSATRRWRQAAACAGSRSSRQSFCHPISRARRISAWLRRSRYSRSNDRNGARSLCSQACRTPHRARALGSASPQKRRLTPRNRASGAT